jgi:antitoxin (DNA-binding transcriptional repressor) of toxin-antitoxin stability system
MRSAQVSELKERLDEVIEAVKNGETVLIREGEKPVAEVSPPVQTVPRDTSPFPDWFFEERPPKFNGGGVLEQLLKDRRESER